MGPWLHVCPFFQSDLTRHDSLDFPNHHPELRGGVFCIEGNCESLLRKDQELMASPQEGAIEAKAAKFADEFAAITRRPPAHARAPC